MTSSSGKDSPVTFVAVLTTLGVVFGDIGTSPLYAIRECFHSLPVTQENIYGALSLFFWSILILISLKYLTLVMRADNRGEGGALALMALAQPNYRSPLFKLRNYISYLGIFAAALLYGDSILTPAISVLSAVEGLQMATPIFEPFIIPFTILILFGLFWIQSKGSAILGVLFGPLMLVWFASLAALGINAILKHPQVFMAINPYWAYHFFAENGSSAFIALGAVFLCLTGGEALYADMGHFGLAPIRRAWYYIAYPGLLLNYFGQGALLAVNPQNIKNPFYLLAPEFLLYPLVVISTLATVVASQAVISGAFSLTSQAIKLGLLPRMPIEHTSVKNIGQIYVSRINWMLLVATVWLVIEFRSSSNLAAAYGIAVSSTMIITTLLTYVVMRNLWGWKRWSAISVAGAFIILDITFFSANIIKIFDGGWFPLAVAFAAFSLMIIWRQGRSSVRAQLAKRLVPISAFIEDLPGLTPLRIPGTAIYMGLYKDLTPPALLYNLKHNKVIHDNIILLTMETEEVPYVSPIKRVEVRSFGKQITQLILHYGFKDEVDLKRALNLCQAQGVEIDFDQAVFFLGRERVHSASKKGLKAICQGIFNFMLSTSQDASAFFGIQAEQMIELGFQVEV